MWDRHFALNRNLNKIKKKNNKFKNNRTQN